MRSFPQDSAGGPTGDQEAHVRTPGHRVRTPGHPVRRLVLRVAFVASGGCGLLLSAGAAAHAESPDPTSGLVTTSTTTVTTTVSDAAGAVETTLGDPTGAVEATLDDANRKVHLISGDAVDTVTESVRDVTQTVHDVADSVTRTVSEVPPDPVRGRLDDAAGTIPGASGTSISVRTGPGRLGFAAADRTASGLRLAATIARAHTLPTSRTAGSVLGTVRNSAGSFPPPGPASGSSPQWPVEPIAGGLVLTLIGVIVHRSASGPPGGWQRRLPRTHVFHAAAVALAVERPG
jgi:hypothetical protein